ncbi:hypothetical protein ACQPXM_11700 [Kribbella sp. CA-253562]|uniref:hypothetical protein n=1 Tax=Kribbella sp. CA-253562 TaxID=3239942 RepID=UPI003D9452F1
MSILKSLPTTIWLVGATAAITAFSPVVGEVVTEPAASAPAAVQTVPATPAEPGTEQSAPPAGEQTPGGADGVETPAPVGEEADASNTPPTGEPSVAENPEPDADRVVVEVGVTRLGKTAVDANGKTLYLSVLDKTDPPRSVCLSAKCVAQWQPVYLPDGQVAPSAGTGVDPQLLGATRRPDGTRQATLGGWPLYRYDQDQAPGEVSGQGLKGTWYAIGPDGKKVVG